MLDLDKKVVEVIDTLGDMRERILSLESALEDLLSVQNGPPLLKYEEEWRAACDRGWELLKK